MKVHTALARAFLAEGVDHVFTLQGDGNIDWLADLHGRDDVRLVHARHEAAAVAMADGYARVTGRVGVCSVTYGPGLTQVGTSLVTALRARTPLVLFVGDVPAADADDVQRLNQQPFIEACGALFRPLRSAATAVEDVAQAFFQAQSEQRPVVLNAPVDIQVQEYHGPEPEAHVTTSSALLSPQTPLPDPAATRVAVDLITSARQPVVLAGLGAVQAGAQALVRALGERTGALLATTLKAKGWLDDDPYAIGLAGGYCSPGAEEMFAAADLVVAVGASLNTWTMYHGALVPGARVVSINADRTALVEGRHRPDAFIWSDARAGVAALLEALVAGAYHASGFRTAAWQAAIEATRDPRPDLSAPVEPGRVHPGALMTTLAPLLPSDAVFVIGAANFWSFPITYWRGEGRPFFFSNDFGAVGQALPLAIGVAFGAGRPVVAVEGDTSIMMHLQELDTVARYDLPLTVLVMDNDAMATEVRRLAATGGPLDLARIPSPRLAAVAEAMGVRGIELTSLETVPSSLRPWPTRGTLIAAKTSPNVFGRPVKMRPLPSAQAARQA